MAKTTKTKAPAKRGKAKAATPAASVNAELLADRRLLQQNRRIQRELIALGNQLARTTRKADYALADLGARLLDRARRVQQGEAAKDFVRDTAVMDRQPVIGD